MRFVCTAALQAQAVLLDQCRDFVEALRMARHDHDQQALDTGALQCIQQQCLFALARAGCQKNFPAETEAFAQLCTQFKHRGRRDDVELEVAHDGHGTTAEAGQPLRVILGLCGDEVQFVQSVVGEFREARIARSGLFRQTRIEQ